MKVKAAPGLKVPTEHDPRQYITDAPEGVEIAHSHYYVRRLATGDLVEAEAPPASVPARSKTAKD